MKITGIEIDGFGVWHDLKLLDLSPRVTAFYGPNEAGKSTLMQFVRSVLYGVSPERRRKYLPPLHGGRPGGALGIVDGDLHFQTARFADRSDQDVGLVICATDDGSAGGDRLLREALDDVDEQTFTNVFAVGLSEIQQLGTLSGTRAAEWLYRLTSGLDRVSLYDVIQNLGQSRLALLAEPTQPSKILELQQQREQLYADVERLRERNRQWSQSAVKAAELDQRIEAVERELRDHEHAARTIEIAVGVKSNWLKRQQIEQQLIQLVRGVQLPDDAVDRLNDLNAKIEEHRRQADVLQGQRHQLRDEAQRLGVNELLVRNACRIDALGEQRDWLTSLQRQRDDLEREARQFENRFTTEQKRLAEALGMKEVQQLREISTEDLEQLQPQIEAVQSANKRLAAVQRSFEALTENERSLQTQIESAMIDGGRHGLPMDVQEASDLVANLRKRLQVEQRIEQARQHELDLEQQSHELLDDQVMPLWLFGWTFAGVVAGALMIALALLVPDSPLTQFGGLTVLVSGAIMAFCFIFKYFTEDAAADRLDACQQQLATLARQIDEAEVEKKKLDATLPLADGSVVLRLQAAERHLAELENVLPVEAQRQQAGGAVADGQSRLQQAKRELDAALKDWQSTAVALGFPESLDPQRLASVVDRFAHVAELESRAKHRREDAAARQREYELLLRRVSDIAEETDCQCEDDGADAIGQLDHLLSERRRQQVDVQRREELANQAGELKLEEGKRRRAIVGLNRRREALFQSADCSDEQEYRMLAADQRQSQLMKNQRESISREIAAAIGAHEPEETFAELLSPEQIGSLEKLWEKATAHLDQRQSDLKQLAQQRGALVREQQTILEDRSLAEAQLDLNVCEQQLQRAREDWRRHATVNRVLEQIRAVYETDRQPETLAEASRYLEKLTSGRYRRVWTPLANDILLVETAAGESLPVDVLSRGTREQLFLSVRMALVATFARRGVNLPMVLDDVLVNFDADRCQRATEVLLEFADRGHQLLAFTCHEHMWRMFQKLGADCRRLPARPGGPTMNIADNVEAPPIESSEPVLEEPTEPEPQRKKRRKRKRESAVDQSPPEQLVEEPVEPLFEYPFTERLVEQEILATLEDPEPSETSVDLENRGLEYSLEDSTDGDVESHAAAVAYIVGDQSSRLDWDIRSRSEEDSTSSHRSRRA